MNSEAVATVSSVHVFEAAGLGKAPFKLGAIVDTAAGKDAQGLVLVGYTPEGFAIHTTPGGTCAYCGHAIIVLCKIVSADGQRFHVGTDCVNKTGDAGMEKRVATFASARASKQRKALAAAKKADLATLLADETVCATLAAMPHPLAWRAAQGDTLLGWAQWMAAHSGAAGKAKTLKAVKAALAVAP
jgi:hypothetical protein